MSDYPQFAPQYIRQEELNQFGLPTPDLQSDVMMLVEMASIIIDEECGRIDGDGNGSLVYSTWVHRTLIGSGRNMVETPMKPLVALDAGTVAGLQAAATGAMNSTYTGVQPNTITSVINGSLSPILGCSGRFGTSRRDMQQQLFGASAFFSWQLLSAILGGGPAPWMPVDVTQIDYDPRTGELWLPMGFMFGNYSEVMLVYNSGFNPLAIPRGIKHVVSSLVKNAMASGDGTTFLMGLTVAKSGTNVQFGRSILDPVLSAMLTPYRNVRGY